MVTERFRLAHIEHPSYDEVRPDLDGYTPDEAWEAGWRAALATVVIDVEVERVMVDDPYDPIPSFVPDDPDDGESSDLWGEVPRG